MLSTDQTYNPIHGIPSINDRFSVPACSASLDLRPLRLFGAEIFGFEICRVLREEIRQALRSALNEHKMLIIRGCELTPADQIALTRCFGKELHTAGPNLRKLAAFPEIFRISNRRQEGNYNTGQYWHCDGHYLADPSAVSVMHIVEPTPDGQTLVTDLASAYERLPGRVRSDLSKLGSVAPETGVVQPLVRKHPVSDTVGLYVNLRARTINRFGELMPHVDEALEKHLNQTGTFYGHCWERGDTIIVDNFAVCHRGMPSDPVRLRIMHRTTVTGPGVWWREGKMLA